MRLVPMFKADADKGSLMAKFLTVIAVLGLAFSIITLNIEEIIGSVILLAVAGLLDNIYVIMCNSKGYYVEYDETDQPSE